MVKHIFLHPSSSLLRYLFIKLKRFATNHPVKTTCGRLYTFRTPRSAPRFALPQSYSPPSEFSDSSDCFALRSPAILLSSFVVIGFTDCSALRPHAILLSSFGVIGFTDCSALRPHAILRILPWISDSSDCSALRAPAILHNIRISRRCRTAFMLMLWRVPRS